MYHPARDKKNKKKRKGKERKGKSALSLVFVCLFACLLEPCIVLFVKHIMGSRREESIEMQSRLLSDDGGDDNLSNDYSMNE